jgi:tetratricopeptide (TPR) repeat protein
MAADAGPVVEPGERWSLLDRRDFLRRSLEDAEREHAAGDLGDADYALLHRRDEARLAEVEARLDALEAGTTQAPTDTDGPKAKAPARAGATSARPGRARRATGHRLRRPRRRAWLGVVGTLVVVAGAVVLVVSLTSTRLPGQVATGGVELSGQRLVEQQLNQAAVLDDQGNVVEALQLYQEVLAESPRQSTALAEAGWLEWESGSGAGEGSLEAKGRASVAEAVQVAPGFYAGHLYLGTIDLEQGDDAAAVAQYRLFLADHPPAKWTRDYAPQIREAFSAAGQPVPSGVPK